MIYTEEAEFVRFTLLEGDIAVPVSIIRQIGEPECIITVYSEFYEVASTFLKLFGEDPFTDEAVAFLKNKLTEPMQQRGFKITRDINNRIRTFLLRSEDEVDLSVVTDNTRIVSGKDDLTVFYNATTHQLEMDEEDPDDISAIIVEDGKLVAYATLNDVFDEEEHAEISVECAVGFRGRGYAASCAAALAKELCARGRTVSYKCRHSNAASMRVAEKAGFTQTSMEYNFVCYRDE